MKLCQDCRWFDEAEIGDRHNPVCRHSTSQLEPYPDYVRGRRKPKVSLPCQLARQDPDRCGPEGQYFEPNDGRGFV
jgi:hypothetical protein